VLTTATNVKTKSNWLLPESLWAPCI